MLFILSWQFLFLADSAKQCLLSNRYLLHTFLSRSKHSCKSLLFKGFELTHFPTFDEKKVPYHLKWKILCCRSISILEGFFFFFFFFNPWTSESDWLLISPYRITLESNVKVTRKQKIITNFGSPWLWSKFSLSVP